jgi:hypothetical protein
VNTQTQWCVTRQFARPIENERLDARIQVALAKRRRIYGIEELSQFGDADFDDGGLQRSDVTGRRPSGWHESSRLGAL